MNDFKYKPIPEALKGLIPAPFSEFVTPLEPAGALGFLRRTLQLCTAITSLTRANFQTESFDDPEVLLELIGFVDEYLLTTARLLDIAEGAGRKGQA